MRLFLTSVVLLLLVIRAGAEPPPRTVEVWGEAVASGDVTDREARRAALDDARARAVELVCGIEVSSAGLYAGGLEKGYFVQSLSRGHLVEEEVLEWRSEAVQEGPAAVVLRHQVRLRATVAQRTRASPTHLRRIELNRRSFESGDRAELTISSDREAWIYVFHISPDERGTLVFPNAYQPRNRVSPAAALRFPSPESGSVLETVGVDGREETREAFLVLAFPNRARLHEQFRPGAAYSLSELARLLLRCSTEEPEARLLPFSVHAKSPSKREPAISGIMTE